MAPFIIICILLLLFIEAGREILASFLVPVVAIIFKAVIYFIIVVAKVVAFFSEGDKV